MFISLTNCHVSFKLANDTKLVECFLIFQDISQLYNEINSHSLFNLKSDLRGFFPNNEFLSNLPIEMEAVLHPDLLIHLQDYTTPEAATTYLQTLSETQPDHPLLKTENWFALSIKQQQETGEVGYRTLWYYINPTQLLQNNLSNEAITAGMISFFQDHHQSQPQDPTTENLQSALADIIQAFDQSIDNNLADSESAIDTAIAEAPTAIDSLIESISEVADATQPSIYTTVIQFFTEDDWSFTKIQGEPLLQILFQGEITQWTCYAKIKEEQQQFLFYTLCPIIPPANHRPALAEFITRANYGMTIGNFELDYTDGEIRYKTSIDVENDRLTPALIQTLVYTNITMMDQYLPGIQAILDHKMTPAEAIQAIEQPF
jgi:hypothetical protein